MWYTYILQSNKTGKWYTGMTVDLRKRFFIDNKGLSRSTKSGKPWKLIYYEACLDRHDARAREKYLKSGNGKRYMKNRLKIFFAQASNGV